MTEPICIEVPAGEGRLPFIWKFYPAETVRADRLCQFQWLIV